MSRKNRARNDNLYKAILELQNIEEAKNFFDDLCTVKELEAMEQRYQVAMYLRNGLNYNEILQKTGSSSATISRVNRSLQYGTGGYEVIMARLDEKE
ncbi:MAG: TrpR-like protein [Clostridiales bacterium]|jgi:TrpR-related protein YerC/YecD|nr:TrpR-like protein [Clostridiales bacterium]